MIRFFYAVSLIWVGTSLLLCRLAPSPGLLAAAGIAGTAAIGLLWKKGKTGPAVLAAAFLLCVGNFALFCTRSARAETLEGKLVTLNGQVQSVEKSSTGLERLILKVSEDGPEGLRGERVRLTLYTALDVQPADVVKCTVKLDYGLAGREQVYADGLRFYAVPEGGIEVAGTAKPTLAIRFARMSERFVKMLRTYLPGEEGNLLACMVAGDSERIRQQTRDNFSDTGLAHLLAVSGLHLSILAGTFDRLLSRLLPFRARHCMMAGLVIFYMMFAGMRVSVVRAGIMTLVCILAKLLGRDTDTLNSLGFAACVLLLGRPYTVCSLSFQLSYFSVMGLALFTEPLASWLSGRLCGKALWELEEIHPRAAGCLTAVCAPVAANILILPVQMSAFGSFPVYFLVMNLLALPVMPLLLGSGMACGIAGLLGLELAAKGFGLAAGLSAKWLLWLAEAGSGMPLSVYYIRDGWVVVWTAAAVLFFTLLWAGKACREIKRYAASVFGLAFLIGAFSGAVWISNPLEIAAYQNMTVLIYGNQAAVLGEPENGYEREKLQDLFASRRVERIAVYVAKEEDALWESAGGQLLERYPADHILWMDEIRKFRAELFGYVQLAQIDLQAVGIRVGQLEIVKTFRQSPYQAHLLVNARGEMIAGDSRLKAKEQNGWQTVLLEGPKTGREGNA